MKPKDAVILQREYFNDGKTLSYEARKETLLRLRDAVIHYEQEINNAMYEDLGKSETETYMAEVGIVLEEITYTLKHLKRWMKTKRVRTPIVHFPAKSTIMQEPYGVALIMAPWNYPFQLTLLPVIGAIAAGNTAVVKVSKSCPNVSKVLRELINATFSPNLIYCCDFINDTYEEVLCERYDTIFFTGSQRVGKIVMEAAAQNLTPVILELGGKSPCIIDESADIKLAAKRIAWGKFLNAGQTCVAPDYILVKDKIKTKLIDALINAIEELYGEDQLKNEAYCKIITPEHYDRLFALLQNGEVSYGGVGDRTLQKITPTILDDVTFDSPIMEDEIFGPILPILTYDDIDKTIDHLKTLPKPLALYVFTKDINFEKKITENLIYGSGCVNDTVVQVANRYLPFGGVGESGMGMYHGKKSFDAFSHAKSMMKKANWLDIKLRYPPYSEKVLRLIKRVMK